MSTATHVTLADAAEMLSVSQKTVRRYIADGLLPAYRLGPRKIRVSVFDVDALLTPMQPDEISAGESTPPKREPVEEAPQNVYQKRADLRDMAQAGVASIEAVRSA